MPEAVKITSGGLRTLLGIDPTVNTDPHDSPTDVSFVNRYSPSELKAQLRRLYVRPEDSSFNTRANPAGIISYLNPVSEKIGAAKIEAKRLRKLAPEIDQARTLIASSVLSPNDLQDGEFTFNFPGVPALEEDPELLRKVAEYYSNYFNNTLKLGIKSFDWIGEAIYESGAKCLLTLPVATQEDLRHRSMRTITRMQTNLEAGFESLETESLNKELNYAHDYMYSNMNQSFAEFCRNEKTKTSVNDLLPQMEAWGIDLPYENLTRDQVNSLGKMATDYRYNHDRNYVSGMERMIVNLRAKLGEGDIIRISENTDCFRYIQSKQANTTENFWQKLSQQYGFNHHPNIEEMAILDANPSHIPHQGIPAVLELPTESVIPIFIPGSPSEHLGYFVVLDNHGLPISISEADANNRMYTNKNAGFSSAKAYDAFFGSNCCNATFHDNVQQYSQMGSLIFNDILDAYIRTRIKGIWHEDDLEIGRFNALAAILFQRTLDAKETTLVFVPPMLMTYIAFDYYDDSGVGKSKLSDIQFILSLRTTLMMANVIAAVKDAIDHKKIEFGVDDKVTNLEAIMKIIGNIFIEKNKLNGSIEPAEIMRDMYSNALTIVPKNIPGLSDMSVDVSSATGSSARVDDTTMDNLNKMTDAIIGVPSAFLNQTSEVEYARSLVVSNLYFAKTITRLQRAYCGHTDKFVRNYTKVAPKFRRGLEKIISVYSNKSNCEKLEKKTQQLKDRNPNDYSPLSALVDMILTQVTTSLPKPNIVVDKAQFEEINSYLQNLQGLADRFFNQEMIPSDDTLSQTALPIAKAKWMNEQLAKFITEVGSFKMCDIPTLEDMDPLEVLKELQPYENLGAALKKHVDAMLQNAEEPDEGGGDFGGGTDSFGGGFEDAVGGETTNLGGGESGGGSDFDQLGGTGPEQGGESGVGENPTMQTKIHPLSEQYLRNIRTSRGSN